MKKRNKSFYLGIILTLTFVSCTVEKRIYNSGYHISWKTNQISSDKNEIIETKKEQDGNPSESIGIEKTKSEIFLNEKNGINREESVSIQRFEENEVKNETVKSTFETVKSTSNLKNKSTSFSNYKTLKKVVKHKKSNQKDDSELILLIILCFFIPPIAVGIATDWDLQTVLLNVLLTFLCFVPGLIHGIIVVTDNR